MNKGKGSRGGEGGGGGGSKKKEDVNIDQEQQFILRLPPGPGMALRHEVKSGTINLKDKLSIELPPDSRHGKVTYGGYVFNAKLVDLPCIIESLKTTDRKSFYKTADICQMLLCTNDDDDLLTPIPPPTDNSPKKKEKDKRYLWNHGICPPLKNVRRKRFRKVLQKKYQEQPDIEKEVKSLFRMDNEAIDIKWEIVYEDEKTHEGGGGGGREEFEIAGGSGAGEVEDDSAPPPPRKSAQSTLGLVDIFGDVSSSDDDDDDNDEDDRLGVGKVEGVVEGERLGGGGGEEEFADVKGLALQYNNPSDADDSEIPTLHNNLEVLGRELDDLQEKRIQQEMEISILDNSALKDRLQSELDIVIEEERRKRHDYEILSSVLNQS